MFVPSISTWKPGKLAAFSLVYINQLLKQLRVFNSTSSSSNDGKSKFCSGIALPTEPQNCCMSGCANCVWIAYAEEVAKLLNDGGQTAKKKILENVKDPNLRAFLMLELSHLFKKNP